MKIKRITSIFLIVIMSFIFTSCLVEKCDYPFDQNIDNVVSVEIRSVYSKTKTYIIKELEDDDAKAILNDLSNVKCQEISPHDEPSTCGPLVVYIIYKNGESEAIGYECAAHISKNGFWTMKLYEYDATQFAEIVCRYVDSRLVPEINQFLPQETFPPITTEP